MRTSFFVGPSCARKIAGLNPVAGIAGIQVPRCRSLNSCQKLALRSDSAFISSSCSCFNCSLLFRASLAAAESPRRWPSAANRAPSFMFSGTTGITHEKESLSACSFKELPRPSLAAAFPPFRSLHSIATSLSSQAAAAAPSPRANSSGSSAAAAPDAASSPPVDSKETVEPQESVLALKGEENYSADPPEGSYAHELLEHIQRVVSQNRLGVLRQTTSLFQGKYVIMPFL